MRAIQRFYHTSVIIQLLSYSLYTNADTVTYANGEVGLDGVLTDTTTIPSNKAPDDNNVCRLYLAQSSIPNAGLGLYSGIDVKKGDKVSSSDICIHLIDMEHSTIAGEYAWAAHDVGAEFEAVSVESLCPGLGMAVNSHSGLNNVENGVPTYDSGGLHRSTHPGAGAITYYHNLGTEALQDIPAGSEIFASYGEQWFVDRAEELGDVPLSKDFALADHVSEAMELYMNDYGHQTTSEEKEHVMKLVKNVLGIEATKKALQLIPESLDEVSKAVGVGSARYNIPESVRSHSWLETNGYCVDKIKAGPSTNPAAGRGAFATRHIVEGEVISASPLLRFHRGDFILPAEDDLESRQLLLNYCFGHPHSTVLFFPYGPLVNLINHDSTTPNAEIRWSQKEAFHNQDMHESSFADILENTKEILMIEYVAKREIKPGEEIFIDYGSEWEEAWKDYVKDWMPSEDSDDYIMPSTFNRSQEDKPVLTLEEQTEAPYPDNIITACFYDFVQFADSYEYEEDEDGMTTVEDTWEETEEVFNCHHHLRPCDILIREENSNGETLYTVQMFNLPDTSGDNDFIIPDTEQRIVTDVPRRAIMFVDIPYTGDQHLVSAFRQPIGFPDSIFPSSWKNA